MAAFGRGGLYGGFRGNGDGAWQSRGLCERFFAGGFEGVRRVRGAGSEEREERERGREGGVTDNSKEFCENRGITKITENRDIFEIGWNLEEKWRWSRRRIFKKGRR